ncbi:GlxA family transcriptional regulator [Curtobacterium sp. PhB115]|uniref:GlxA family transcriptional regulator n=1 Tax=Curtobacterium sp. PhB115 TaxID=2485173 RepID=UPI000F4CDA28|nr:DJ-1/PfpI family protein [Curtobacterium sp. PhB115]ROP65444.1 transcriptional regulator GlxA family with amidase domain [Curtobacterium sp. PhB115]
MPSSSTVTVGVLVFDGVKMLDFAGPAEVFAEANLFGAAYHLTYVSPDGRDVSTSIGTRVGADVSAADAPPFDVVVIPGSELAPPVFVTREVAESARRLVDGATRVASICSGAFVLASIGTLDGRRAVTHWKFVDELRTRYPSIVVESDAIFVKDGDVYSSAGVAAGIDLGLALVEEDHGADLARQVAQGLLVYMQRAGGQSQFSAPLQLPAPTTQLVRAVVEIVQSDPTAVHSVQSLAHAVSVSPRHLTRRFREEVDRTPSDFVASLRLDIAKAMLDRGFSVARTAEESGYSSPEALRRAFIGRLGISPSRYRRRFLSTQRVPR